MISPFHFFSLFSTGSGGISTDDSFFSGSSFFFFITLPLAKDLKDYRIKITILFPAGDFGSCL